MVEVIPIRQLITGGDTAGRASGEHNGVDVIRHLVEPASHDDGSFRSFGIALDLYHIISYHSVVFQSSIKQPSQSQGIFVYRI
jgi:hypothetical protein